MEFRLTRTHRDFIQGKLPIGFSLIRGGVSGLENAERKAFKKIHIEHEETSHRITRREMASEQTKSLFVSQHESRPQSEAKSHEDLATPAFSMQFTIPKFVLPISSNPSQNEIRKETQKESLPQKISQEQVEEPVFQEKLDELSNEENFQTDLVAKGTKTRPSRMKKSESFSKFPFKSKINIEKNGDAFQKGMFNIVQLLKNHKSAHPFLEPIDPIQQGIPDYFEIIQKPMDLSFVENKIMSSKYSNMEDFVEDCSLIWNNAKTYNAPSTPIYSQAVEMEYAFDLLVRRFESHYKKLEGLPDFYRFKRKIQTLNTKAKKLFRKKEPEHREFISRVPAEGLELTPIEKEFRLALARNIKKIPAFTLRNIPDFIDFGDDNDVEIDIQRLSVEDFNTLKAFIDKKSKAFALKELEKVEDSGASGWSSSSDSEESVFSLLLS